MGDERPATDEPAKPANARLERAKKGYSLVSDIFTPTRLLVLLAVLILLPVSLWGGLDAVAETPEDLPTVDAWEALETNPLTITPTKFLYGDSINGVLSEQIGARYLFLAVDVTNTSDAPVSSTLLTSSLTLGAQQLKTTFLHSGKLAPPVAYRINDGLQLGALQPDVTVPVLLVWQQNSAVPAPAEVEVTASSWTWRADSLTGSLGWRDQTPEVLTTLPLTPAGDA